mmetsp:Transcript_22786/g.40062  ORF Transcript_22786/g.40062 Transcript_22786/m.40062 type:complete len:271 (-) Transcript_22786:395-1207(-)
MVPISCLHSMILLPDSQRPQPILRVATECSASLQPGATVATTWNLAPGVMKLARKTRVRLFIRYGTCDAPEVRALMHSFKACNDELISAPSLWRSAVCEYESSLRSLPAQSRSTSVPPLESCRNTAMWDREETPLAKVLHVVRRCCPNAKHCSSSSAEPIWCTDTPTMSKSPDAVSLRVMFCAPVWESKSRTSFPANSSIKTEMAPAAHKSTMACSCIADIVYVFPLPVAPYMRHVDMPPSNACMTSGLIAKEYTSALDVLSPKDSEQGN